MTCKGSRNIVDNGQSLYTNPRIRDMSILALKQTEVKLWFIIANSRLCDTHYQHYHNIYRLLFLSQ